MSGARAARAQTGGAPAVSPCVNVCTLDPEGRLCLGCYRTLDEISAWAALDEAQRRVVLARVERRLAACFDDVDDVDDVDASA